MALPRIMHADEVAAYLGVDEKTLKRSELERIQSITCVLYPSDVRRIVYGEPLRLVALGGDRVVIAERSSSSPIRWAA